MACLECISYTLPACPESIHLVDSGLNEAVDYYIQFTDKSDNKIVTKIEAPFLANDIIIPILNNADIPQGLFTQFSGMFKMEILDATDKNLVSFAVNGVQTTCVLLSFQHYEGVQPQATIHGA